MNMSPTEYSAVKALVVAVDRMIDQWAESDEAVKHNLWTAMSKANEDVATICSVYPL